MLAQGLKRVSGQLLDPGTHYLKPYMNTIVEVNPQSQRFEMSGRDVLNVLTLDGFPVTVIGPIVCSYKLPFSTTPLPIHSGDSLTPSTRK